MDFIKYSYTEKVNFNLRQIEKIKFKNTYYEISVFHIEGCINNQKDIDLLEYLLKKNMDYNAKATSKIIDFTFTKFNDSNIKFNLSNQYSIIVKNEMIQHPNKFKTILDAINFFVKFNKKKFPNSKYKKFDNLPEMDEIIADKKASNVSIKTMLSKKGNIGYLKLEGKYPYKGYLEANYISNMLDILIEFESINKLIIDTFNFELERDWDDDLPDLEPTHIKYFKTKEVSVHYLVNDKKGFMSNHKNLHLNLDNV